MSLTLLRKERGFTSQIMADELGISQGHYSHLENGTRLLTPELKEKLCKILSIEIETLNEKLRILREESGVVQHWIASIRIHQMPLTRAFLEDLKYNPLKDKKDKVELISRLAQFVANRIGDEIIDELKKDDELVKYFQKRI
jgi:transcriptional regulator with XRE-family HTH domain